MTGGSHSATPCYAKRSADDLLPGEAPGALHLALARAFERTWAAEAGDAIDRAAAIAFHYAAAGDQPGGAAREHRGGDRCNAGSTLTPRWPSSATARSSSGRSVENASAVAQLDRVGLLALAAQAHSLSGNRVRRGASARSSAPVTTPTLSSIRSVSRSMRSSWPRRSA